MGHRSYIIVGDVTSHGGVVLSGSAGHHLAGRPVARVGDMVSCPSHGNNAIMGGGTPLLDGRPMAVEGMITGCGSHLIASQTMFNMASSPKNDDGGYKPLWNVRNSRQTEYNPHNVTHGPDRLPGEEAVSELPPDNMPVSTGDSGGSGD